MFEGKKTPYVSVQWWIEIHNKGYVTFKDNIFPTRVSLKGTVSRDGYFFEGLNILICTFCVYVLKVFKAYQKLFTPYTVINFLDICYFDITY